MISLHHIAQALDSTAIRKIPTEPTGFMHGCIYLANAGAYELAAKIFNSIVSSISYTLYLL
ncbi:MAG: hypothetical protein OFPII_30100 [Osedax symbiont Rs1]|nr:MAG: hypothetical protein OFPII_30100 [Osedax symbiont Rs1]